MQVKQVGPGAVTVEPPDLLCRDSLQFFTCLVLPSWYDKPLAEQVDQKRNCYHSIPV
jgi:hypothetical protein